MVSRPGEWEKKEGNVTASIWLGHLGVSPTSQCSQLQMGRLSSGVLFESCRKQLADLGFGDMFSYISPLQSPLLPRRLRAARPAVRLSARTQKPQNPEAVIPSQYSSQSPGFSKLAGRHNLLLFPRLTGLRSR